MFLLSCLKGVAPIDSSFEGYAFIRVHWVAEGKQPYLFSPVPWNCVPFSLVCKAVSAM